MDGISWVYYATGRNCDTTAEASTIQGAIKHHLQTTDGSKLCGTECLDLTHSGTWSGYLLIGPTSSFKSTTYCGPVLSGRVDSKVAVEIQHFDTIRAKKKFEIRKTYVVKPIYALPLPHSSVNSSIFPLLVPKACFWHNWYKFLFLDHQVILAYL